MAKVIRTTAAGVNIRTAPSTTATRVATVGAGVVLGASPNFGATVSGGGLQWYPTTLSAQAAASIGNPWYSGKTVYVAAQYAEAVDAQAAANTTDAANKAKAEAAINEYMGTLNLIAQQNIVAATMLEQIRQKSGNLSPALIARWNQLNEFVFTARQQALVFCGGIGIRSGGYAAGTACIKAVGLEQLSPQMFTQWQKASGLSGTDGLGFLPWIAAAARVAWPWIVRASGRIITWAATSSGRVALYGIAGYVLISYAPEILSAVWNFFTGSRLNEAKSQLQKSNEFIKEITPLLPPELQDKAKGLVDDNQGVIDKGGGGGFFSQTGNLLKWGIVGAAAFLIIPKIVKK